MLHLAISLFLCSTNVYTQDGKINIKTENFIHTYTYLWCLNVITLQNILLQHKNTC